MKTTSLRTSLLWGGFTLLTVPLLLVTWIAYSTSLSMVENSREAIEREAMGHLDSILQGVVNEVALAGQLVTSSAKRSGEAGLALLKQQGGAAL